MKKAILVLAVIASLVSCNGSSEVSTNDTTYVSGDDSSVILPALVADSSLTASDSTVSKISDDVLVK